MKLSGGTLSILKNFSDINKNILIRKGQRIRTISQSRTVLGQAEVSDNIPVDVAIFDLKKLLSAIGLFSEPELDFHDSYLTIKSGPSTMRYIYANPDVLRIAPDNEVEMKPFVTVSVPCDVISGIERARRTLSLDQISIEGNGGKLLIKAVDASGASRDEFAVELGDSDRKFKAVLQAADLNLITTSYEVEIDKRGITHWKGENVEYWISLNVNHSEFLESVDDE